MSNHSGGGNDEENAAIVFDEREYDLLVKRVEWSADSIKSRQGYCFSLLMFAMAFHGFLVPLLSSTLKLDCGKRSILKNTLRIVASAVMLLLTKLFWDLWAEESKLRQYYTVMNKMIKLTVPKKLSLEEIVYALGRCFKLEDEGSHRLVDALALLGYLVITSLGISFFVFADSGNISAFDANCHNETRH